MPPDTLNTLASLQSRQIGHGRAYVAATEPQRHDLTAQANPGRASRERIEPQPSSGQVSRPGIRVEYQQDQPVLMVHDRRGVLIYQVPPKGALQLILQEDTPSGSLSERA